MRSVFSAAALGLAGVLVVFGGVAEADTVEEPGVYADVDAGSFGLGPASTTDVWCLVDAGSLGLEDPLTVCGR